MPFLQPVPRATVVLQSGGIISQTWDQWFQVLLAALNGIAQLGASDLVTQGASLPATTLAVPRTAGLYQVSYAARITRAATVSSSLTVTVRWVSGGVACAQSGAAMTGNTTATVQSGSLLIQADAGTPIRLETTYASSGATTMQYALSTRVNAVP